MVQVCTDGFLAKGHNETYERPWKKMRLRVRLMINDF